jgi:ribonuclease Z
MSLEVEILGGPGDDNAALVRVNTGQATHRLLFDCGEACLSQLEFSEVLQINHLCFSHLHMDHIAGFDSYFRANFQRPGKTANQIWGPPETARIVGHRMQGFLWNLNAGLNAAWTVHDVTDDAILSSKYELGEAFSVRHEAGVQARTAGLIQHRDFTLEALTMNHGTPSLAYIVRESPRVNLDMAKLAALGLTPGPWVGRLKDQRPQTDSFEIAGVPHDLAHLRSTLLVTSPGQAVAYLTDFRLDDLAFSRLEVALKGCRLLVCESQYVQADLELAVKNHHMTAVGAATLAARAGVEELVLFHVSNRYADDRWAGLLAEARAIFPNTRFPARWNLEAG